MPTFPGIGAGAGGPIAYPPAALFTSTYLELKNFPAGDVRRPSETFLGTLETLFADLNAMPGAHDIPTFSRSAFQADALAPDVTKDPPWRPEYDQRFRDAITAAPAFVAANIDNEWIPLTLDQQLLWAAPENAKTKAQWVAYVHGMCTTFMATADTWGLLWKLPLTPSKQSRSWQPPKLDDWKTTAEFWRPIFEGFNRIGIVLDTFTAGGVAQEEKWVPDLIEQTREKFPNKPIFCVVSPTIKEGGIARPIEEGEGIDIVRRRHAAGADGIHLFPVARNSLAAGSDFMGDDLIVPFADECRAMMCEAIDIWSTASLEG